MSVKTYTLRPAYEGVLVGGTVVAGPNGESINILDALEEGGGKITTDSNVLQGSLESYYGHEGFVFDASTVDVETGEEEPVVRQEEQQPEVAPIPAVSSAGVAAGNVPAQHSDDTDYGTFSAEELRSTLQERSIGYEGRPTKDQMISLLQQDDENRLQEGMEGADNNGS